MSNPDIVQSVQHMMAFLNDILQLPDYEVSIEVDTRKVIKSSHDEAAASVLIDHRVKHVQMYVADDFEDPRQLFDALVHECLHIKLAPLDQFYTLWAGTYTGRESQLFQATYQDADEQVTVSLERALAPILWEGFNECRRTYEGRMDDSGFDA